VAVFLLTVVMAIPGGERSGAAGFALGTPGMQFVVDKMWIPAFNIHYALGADGISFPLVMLTSFLGMLSMAASWPIAKHVKGYCILFLLLETGMLGVFLALDFFLFYVFWEVMLLPMYFLIGVWGGPRREYAAIKFFLFTLVGSVLMLIALLMLYFASDLNKLPPELQAKYRTAQVASAEENPASAAVAAQVGDDRAAKPGQPAVQTLGQAPLRRPENTFNITALAALGQLKDSPFKQPLWGKTIEFWPSCSCL